MSNRPATLPLLGVTVVGHEDSKEVRRYMTECATGRCGALGQPDSSVCFGLWAPRAAAVDLVLIDGTERRTRRMVDLARGYFQHTEPQVADGQRYAYRLDGGPERPDPASLWQPDGVHVASAVFRPERFAWTDGRWTGMRRADLVFYEVHVGTFTSAGTFEAIIPRLEGLRGLGITALQLMPVAQFPGTRNWGYDGVHPYAAQNSYGGPHGLQRLVDACHAHGLALFLDMVYNHFGPEGNYTSEFGPYLTDRYHTPWGMAVNYDGPGSDPVRQFVLNNVRMWLEEFHVDGLRLDAVHALYDRSPHPILRAIQEVADDVAERAGRRVHVVAESDLNDPRLLRPPEQGGHGMSAQWSDDFHHAVHALLTGERQGYYVDFGRPQHLARALEQPFVYAGDYSPFRDRTHGAPADGLSGDRFVVSIQNHDQVGNRARGDRLGMLLDSAGQRLAACLLFFAPHLPLLFMGEEYGEVRPFLYFCSFGDPQLVEAVRKGRRQEFAAFAWQGEVPDPQDEATFVASRLSWSWPEDSPQAGLRRLYADLLAARRRWPALRDFNHRAARLSSAEGASVLELVRGGDSAGPNGAVTIYFNLTAQPQRLLAQSSAKWPMLFTSEAGPYGGRRQDVNRIRELLPHECVAFGPPEGEKA
jgi:maltooligosyltrehalose trehalohydrolase